MASDHPVVALLTDFGGGSIYAGVMRAVCQRVANVPVVDVTHDVSAHAVDQASFMLRLVYPFFPAGSVFCVIVDPGVGGNRGKVIVEFDGRFVVGPDNGILSDLLLQGQPTRMFEIDDEQAAAVRPHKAIGHTFHGRDVFAPVAAALVSGVTPESLGRPLSAVCTLDVPKPATREDCVAGAVRYVDSFGNMMTNVAASAVVAEGYDPRTLCACVDGKTVAAGLHDSFESAAGGDPAILANSWGLLELFIREGRAYDRFAPQWPVNIEFRPAAGA